MFLLAVVIVAGFLYANVQRGLKSRGLTGGFDFLYREAGPPIGEGIEYQEGDPYWHAFWVGVVNTIRVSLFGIILATALGTLTGIARLSSNWLLRKLAGGYIEVVRNVPLLVQLVFWYFAVILRPPRVKESIVLPGSIFLSNRGAALPSFTPTEAFYPWLAFLAAGLITAALLWRWRIRRQERTGEPSHAVVCAAAALVGLTAIGWVVGRGRPLAVNLPEMGGFNYQGGLTLTPEFTAMLVGLTVYTGAFIAEVVRAGIQAVHVGQKEAARALGFSGGLSLRLIVLPQAVRVIIPPLISQHLNLAKNSSLAIAVGFPDLFAIAEAVFNQTGKAVEVIGMVMASYLVMSLCTSLVLNLYNRRLRFAERGGGPRWFRRARSPTADLDRPARVAEGKPVQHLV
ncbi:MAG: amino acid ABC transporter permease [Candidatus Methylomirabilia bacterium]